MLIDDIRSGENDQLEFKEVPNHDSARWLKTVVAFANGRGGRIIFGVSNVRQVVGLKGDLFAMKDAIADAIADACVPPVSAEMCVSTIEGKPVIVLEIDAGRQTPYYIKAKGDTDGVYVRFDATTRLADEMALKVLRVDGTGKGYDEMVCRTLKVSDADVTALCQRMYQVALGNARSDEARQLVRPVKAAQLVKWGVLRSAGKAFDATNAYALLTGDDLFAPVVKCAVFKGTTRSIFIDRREFGGPIDLQIEEAYKYVLSKINLGSVFGEGIHRKDVYEIPPSAIREIIVNAVAHRNYVNGEESPITVALYDDRLEVTSPGKLPHGVTVAKMREGCSECRNKALAQALAYMNIIEDWGSGIPRISTNIKDAGLRDLEISAWPNAVRTVIYRRESLKADIENPKVDIEDQKADIESPKGDIGSPKVDIEASKVDIGALKVDIGSSKTDIECYLSGLTGKTRKHIETVLAHASGSLYFKRSDLIGWTGLSHAAASRLLEKLLHQSIIVPVVGHGKGAYRLN